MENQETKERFPYQVTTVKGGKGNKNSLGNLGVQVLKRWQEFRFIYVPLGSVTIHTLEEKIPLTAGEGIFLNLNTAHFIEEHGSCIYHCVSFGRECVEFYDKSPAQTFVSELIEQDVPYLTIFPEESIGQKQILDGILNLISMEFAKGPWYSYEVLAALSGLWLLVMRELDGKVRGKKKKAIIRMEQFLLYIEEHYKEEVTLEMLCESAGVSKSECLRCFKQTLNTTPYKYLLDYRLERAAALLRNSDRQIGEIAVLTGFEQPSYFGKCFKDKVGCTPKTYRNRFVKK